MSKDNYHRRPRTIDDIDGDERHSQDKIVKSYPSISYATECRVPIVAFDKLDGSNVRAEWSRKKGFYKYGTRTRLVDASDPLFGKVPVLIADKYAAEVDRVMRETRWDSGYFFFEFWGPSSFAGMHNLNEQQTVTLIDVAPFGAGILEPERLLKLFGHMDHAKILYQGDVTPEFIESVRDGSLSGMTFEGVVCKGKNDKKTKAPVMFKQKSRGWLDKLREHCGDNDELFRTLR